MHLFSHPTNPRMGVPGGTAPCARPLRRARGVETLHPGDEPGRRGHHRLVSGRGNDPLREGGSIGVGPQVCPGHKRLTTLKTQNLGLRDFLKAYFRFLSARQGSVSEDAFFWARKVSLGAHFGNFPSVSRCGTIETCGPTPVPMSAGSRGGRPSMVLIVASA